MDVSKEYYTLKNIADIFQGYPRQMLRNKQQIQQYEELKLRIVNWQDIRNYNKGINMSDTCEIVNFQKKYTKEIKYMQKGDIIFPVKSGIDNAEIIYIDKEPEEKYIYDSTVLVVRITDKDVDSKYVYIMMSEAEAIQNGLRTEKYESSIGASDKPLLVPRLSKGVLSNMLIRKLAKKEMDGVVNEYIYLKKAQNDFVKRINELQEDKTCKANIIWI